MPRDLATLVESGRHVYWREPHVKGLYLQQTVFLVLPFAFIQFQSMKRGNPLPSLAYALPGLLAMSHLAFAQSLFGLDGRGITLQLLSPLPRWKLLLGRGIALLSIFVVFDAILAAILLVTSGVMRGDWRAHLDQFPFVLIAVLIADLVVVSLGNIVSVVAPTRLFTPGRRAIQGQRMENAGCAAQATRGFLFLPAILMGAILVGLALLPRLRWFSGSRILPDSALWVTIPLGIGLAGGIYALTVFLMGRSLERREERLAAALIDSGDWAAPGIERGLSVRQVPELGLGRKRAELGIAAPSRQSFRESLFGDEPPPKGTGPLRYFLADPLPSLCQPGLAGVSFAGTGRKGERGGGPRAENSNRLLAGTGRGIGTLANRAPDGECSSILLAIESADREPTPRLPRLCFELFRTDGFVDSRGVEFPLAFLNPPAGWEMPSVEPTPQRVALAKRSQCLFESTLLAQAVPEVADGFGVVGDLPNRGLVGSNRSFVVAAPSFQAPQHVLGFGIRGIDTQRGFERRLRCFGIPFHQEHSAQVQVSREILRRMTEGRLVRGDRFLDAPELSKHCATIVVGHRGSGIESKRLVMRLKSFRELTHPLQHVSEVGVGVGQIRPLCDDSLKDRARLLESTLLKA